MRPALLALAVCSSALADPPEEAVPPDAVKEAVRKQTSDVVRCYGRARRRNPTLRGVVEIGGVVVDGRAEEVHVLRSEIDSDKLHRCMVHRIERWYFDPEFSGEWSWPFRFGGPAA